MRISPIATSIFLVTSCITSCQSFILPSSSYSLSSPLKTKKHDLQNNIHSKTQSPPRHRNLFMSTSSPELKLYNSQTRSKDPFTPLAPPTVKMYTCGPTIYDSAHVGNFRAFLTYDLLKRVLSSLYSYNVKHVCNLTDVDDKIIARCNREHKSLQELTTTYEIAFMDDLKALNCVLADSYPRATDHIEDMVQLIQELERKGLAYQSEKEGSWYFNVGAQEGYGTKLVQLDPEKMKVNASGNAGAQRSSSSSSDSSDSTSTTMDADEYDPDKVGIRDFALWKSPKSNFDREDATWDTAIGKGRPGWHLECSAMARRFLGDTIDVHCGGVDLKFPHHENEIAQSEGATGKPFCNCWIHNGFVNIGDEKMSKSKGNFLTLRNACPSPNDVRAYRYLVITSHYRNPLSFTEAAMNAAKGALKRLDSIKSRLDASLEENVETEEKEEVVGEEKKSEIASLVKKELNNFGVALADDLSTPRASASLFAIVKAAENEYKRVTKAEKDDSLEDGDYPPLDLVGLKAVRDAINAMDEVFGVFYTVPKPSSSSSTKDGDTEEEAEEEEKEESVPAEVVELVAARAAAKDAKDWELADSLRSRIGELGFAVKDVKGGEPIVSRI